MPKKKSLTDVKENDRQARERAELAYQRTKVIRESMQRESMQKVRSRTEQPALPAPPPSRKPSQLEEEFSQAVAKIIKARKDR